MKEKEIYQKALELWGEDFQLQMVIEECSELITAICKYKRYVNDEFILEITEELADVEIMCGQMRLLFDNKLVDEIKNKKLERLNKMIKQSKKQREK